MSQFSYAIHKWKTVVIAIYNKLSIEEAVEFLANIYDYDYTCAYVHILERNFQVPMSIILFSLAVLVSIRTKLANYIP